MTTRRNRDAFDDDRRSDGDQVYIQEVPSGVDDVAPKLDRAEARELIGEAQVEPSGAAMDAPERSLIGEASAEPSGAVMAVELADPVVDGLIGEASVEPSGALMEDVLSVLGDDGDTSCGCSHL